MGVLVYLLVLAFLYVFYRVWQGVYSVFGEYYVPWNVAVGARGGRRNISTKVPLHAYVCKTVLLDEVSVNELFRFILDVLDTDVTIKHFHSVLLSYKYVIACRERKDGSLRGMFLLDTCSQETDGQSYTLIRIGLSFFENFYRGGPLIYCIVSYYILIQLLSHPLTPVYIAGKVFSHIGYVALTKNVKEVYPRFDAETPPFIKKLIDDYAESVRHTDEEYDKETCVLKRELSTVKESVAPISPLDLKNPHIQFFDSQNPGWRKGHMLIIMAKVSWSDLLRIFCRAVCRIRKCGWSSGCGQDQS